MNLLLDTHIALRALYDPGALSQAATALLQSLEHELLVSDASIWEVAIKHAKRPADIQAPPQEFHADLLAAGWTIAPISTAAVLGTHALPPIHGDPFDRLLIAQAQAQDLHLVSADQMIAQYQPALGTPERILVV
ncbi:type II toxin-antitoxin system VapC family toxin [Cupriavidus taiwanensis]|uniref:Pilus retraction motor protein n=1 Tax=Cupriavidus taiwanensis TaxID=164546 RepID=A0A7Z7JIK4_9BURK|nr:type II toxin-antitoxin system VapC family toxin [Cupriavidus taiwanensis]SOZ19158.1 Pilus retraction motor protein [Cupriavidus taiwanensis]SOZ97208.1 Pilus retraction motor protein [Cupriavidus taiwanensis]SPC26099.1 Pilus retraction motor protein [Cupriavidus taiwanensis]SPD37768.1 Pilus retraction motor protein [Cupriavidus taiwanensis]